MRHNFIVLLLIYYINQYFIFTQSKGSKVK